MNFSFSFQNGNENFNFENFSKKLQKLDKMPAPNTSIEQVKAACSTPFSANNFFF